MKKFWRKPTFVEAVLLVVVFALMLHVHSTNKELDRIEGVLMMDAMSDTVMTANMGEQAQINDLLIQRLFDVEHAVYRVQ